MGGKLILMYTLKNLTELYLINKQMNIIDKKIYFSAAYLIKSLLTITNDLRIALINC